jgi:hypothetical protein
VNRGAALQLRVNEEFSVNQLDPLLHADEPNPSAGPASRDVKTCPVIGDAQVNFPVVPAKLYLELPRAAVFQRIVQGFLQDAEQGQGNI